MPASAEDLVSMVLFARVVEARSFTGAAAQMRLSKSVVSERIAQLEDRLGTRLLNRTTRRLSLTEAGLELYRRCARIVAEADEAAEMASGMSQQLQGVLRVSAPVSLGVSHLAAVLHDFLALHPGLRVELTAEDHFVDVAHGGFDLVIRVARATRMTDSSVAARRLATDRTLVCGAPSYLARQGRPQSPEELVHHQCLRYVNNTPHEEWGFQRGGRESFVPVKGSFSANSGSVLKAAAVAGMGLGIFPTFMVVAELTSGTLEVVLEDCQWTELGLYALYPDRRHVPAKVRALVDFLAERFRRGLSG